MITRLALGLLLAVTLGAASPVVPSAPRVEAPKTAAFPHRDGPLQAMMVFIPKAQVAEFDKPYDQAPHITPLKTAKVDDVVAVKIIFIGPQANAAGDIDMTYDITILGPDGKPYGEPHKGLEAGRGPMGPVNAVFDNRVAVLMIRFEAQDAKGVYRAVGVLHDNVGGRHLPVEAEIELK